MDYNDTLSPAFVNGPASSGTASLVDHDAKGDLNGDPCVDEAEYARISDPFARGQKLTTASLDAALASARSAYNNAQDNAADAAARAFIVWFFCKSQLASVEMRAAYNVKRDEKNNEIIANNKDVADLVADAKMRASSAKAWLTQEIVKVNDPTRKAELEADLATHDANLLATIAELRQQRLVKINERQNAAPFTEEAKFTLDLVKPSQATQVNRYANAVSWIHDVLYQQGTLLATKLPDAAEITQRILEKGGVEKVAQAQRESRRDADEAIDRILITKGMAEKVKLTLAAMPPIASASMAVDGDNGDMVALLARKCGATVEIVNVIHVPEKQFDGLAAKHLNPAHITGDAAAEFVGELLTATQDIANPVLVYRQDGPIIGTFVKMQDGAPVVYAEPKAVVGKILPKGVDLLLEHEPVKNLSNRLGNCYQRKLVSITVPNDPGVIEGKCPVPAAFAWESVNEKLSVEQRHTAHVLHQWTDLQHLTDMPHEVSGFDPNMTVELDRAMLDQLSAGQIKAYDEDQAATKSTQVLTLIFSGTTLTLKGSKGTDIAQVTIAGRPPKRDCTVTVHPKMLSNVVKMLHGTGAGVFSVSPDTRGAVKFGWETSYGSYAIFIPLCREGRKYETRLFAPMR